MKATFPHMGNNWVSFKALLDALDIDNDCPPPITRQTIKLGVAHSPESACFPFKINLGNFIQALDNGATTLVMAGGDRGTCRFQNYSFLQAKILKELGYAFDMIVLDTNNIFASLVNRLKPLNPEKSRRDVIWAFLFMCFKARALEKIENLRRYKLPREKVSGQTDKAVEDSLARLDKAKTFGQVRKTARKIIKDLGAIPERKVKLIKIGIAGEIYTVSEQAMSFDIEGELAKRGVWVHNPMSFYKWIKVLAGLDIDKYRLTRYARPYLKVKSGGEDQESLGNIIRFARRGFDGAVLIYPFGCLPVNIAKHALRRITAEYRIPVLCLSQDEHSSKEMAVTRIDAFVEMIKRRGL